MAPTWSIDPNRCMDSRLMVLTARSPPNRPACNLLKARGWSAVRCKAGQATGGAAQASTAPPQDASDASKEGKKSSSGDFRVAQVDQGKSSRAPSVGNQPSSSQRECDGQSTGLSEIIVTAQKREERLQDVPVPVSVINAADLIGSNQLRLQDYYTSVPALSVMPAGTTYYQSLSIRGITAGATNPSVGVMLDDVPYGSSTVQGGGLFVPDIDPNDLARVEVLRGPQR